MGYWRDNPPTHIAVALLASRLSAPALPALGMDPEFGDMKGLGKAMGIEVRHASR